MKEIFSGPVARRISTVLVCVNAAGVIVGVAHRNLLGFCICAGAVILLLATWPVHHG